MTVASPDRLILLLFLHQGMPSRAGFLTDIQCAMSCLTAYSAFTIERGAVSHILKFSMRRENEQEMTATQHQITKTVNINVFIGCLKKNKRIL